MTIDEIADDIIEKENYQLAKAFTMVISSLLLSKDFQPIITKTDAEYSLNDDFEKYIIRKEYNVIFDIDTTSHDKKVKNDAIDECIKLIGGNIKSIVGTYNKDTPLTDRASYRIAKNELIKELVKQLEQLKEQK